MMNILFLLPRFENQAAQNLLRVERLEVKLLLSEVGKRQRE
jgi:hypothetical protein